MSYNLHSGYVPHGRMTGGITGHGLYGRSLGGVLLGGKFTKGSTLSADQKRKMYDGRWGQGAWDRKFGGMAQAPPLVLDEMTGALVPYYSEHARMVGSKPRRMTKADKLRGHLQLLADAEKDAARYERAQHPNFAKALYDDAKYSLSVRDMARLPRYVSGQFGVITHRAKKNAPLYFYENKKGKQVFVKEGSAGFVRAMNKGEDLQPVVMGHYPPLA